MANECDREGIASQFQEMKTEMEKMRLEMEAMKNKLRKLRHVKNGNNNNVNS